MTTTRRTRGWEMEHRPVFVPTEVRGYDSHRVHPAVFSAAECRRLVELGTGRTPLDAGLQDGITDRADDRLRRARVGWIAPDDDTRWIFERLASVAEQANEHYGFELTGFTEDIQFTCYDEPGAFYTWHQDGLDGHVAGRKLSLVVQLTDPATYKGSDLELLEISEDYTPRDADHWRQRVRRRGTTVVFPAFEYHRVTPLTSGTRHSLVCWIGGPPFR